MFVRDPFNPVWFLGDPEKKTLKKRVLLVSPVTSYKHNQDVLALKEEERILLQVEFQQTSDQARIQGK